MGKLTVYHSVRSMAITNHWNHNLYDFGLVNNILYLEMQMSPLLSEISLFILINCVVGGLTYGP